MAVSCRSVEAERGCDMLRVVIFLSGFGVLAACGVDGEPVTPTMGATIGVGSGGTYGAGHVGVSKGPFSVIFGSGW